MDVAQGLRFDQLTMESSIGRKDIPRLLEAKLVGAPDRRDLCGIEPLARLGAPLGPGALVAPIPEPYPLTERVTALPPEAIT